MVSWKDIKGFEGRYQVSDDGQVRSLIGESPIILKQTISKVGYARVGLFLRDSYQKKKAVHRLVAQAFIPNPQNKPQVNHKNGVKLDNCVTNLEWNTSSENIKHSFATGLNVFVRGEKHFNAKLTEEKIKEIREIWSTGKYRQKDIGIKFGVSQATIDRVIRGVCWGHIT